MLHYVAKGTLQIELRLLISNLEMREITLDYQDRPTVITRVLYLIEIEQSESEKEL